MSKSVNSVAAGGSAGEATHQYIDRVVKGVFETRRDAYVAAQSISTMQGRTASRTLLSPGRTASRSCALLRLRLPRLPSSTRRTTACLRRGAIDIYSARAERQAGPFYLWANLTKKYGPPGQPTEQPTPPPSRGAPPRQDFDREEVNQANGEVKGSRRN